MTIVVAHIRTDKTVALSLLAKTAFLGVVYMRAGTRWKRDGTIHGIEQVIPKILLLVKNLSKTTLINWIFSFNSTFLLLFVNLADLENQNHKCFRTADTENYSTNPLLKFFGMFWIDSCYVTRVLKIPYWNRPFFKTYFVYCCEFMYRYFNMFVNFGRISFPAAIVGSFLRMLNKQARLLKKN